MIADIRLRKFDMKTLKAGSVVVLIGKRETGKSFLLEIFYITTKTSLLEQLSLEQKVQTPFILIWFHLFIFMENMNRKL